MEFLVISILTAFLLSIIFKKFASFGVDTFTAIVVNYWVCCLTGSLLAGYNPFSVDTAAAWLPYAVVLSTLFISGFYALALCVQKLGIGVTSVTQKMSLILSVSFALWFYSEPTTVLKIIGLALAIPSVLLINLSPKSELEQKEASSQGFLVRYGLPLFVFLNSGLIEISLQYTSRSVITTPEASAYFSISLFMFAAFLGTIAMLFNYITNKKKPNIQSVIAGIVLGVPNYFSIYCLVKALKTYDGSVVYPIVNLSILIMASVFGYFYFKEQLRPINWLGVVLAVLCILLTSF